MNIFDYYSVIFDITKLVLHESKFASVLYIFSEIDIVDLRIQNRELYLYEFSGSWTNSRNLASNLLLGFGHIYSHSKSFNKWLPLANRYKYLFPRYTILLYLLTNSKHAPHLLLYEVLLLLRRPCEGLEYPPYYCNNGT